MKPINKYKVIFWDFDGVILDSNEVRDLGFIEALKEYPSAQVEKLLLFHKKNGGLSRYVKFRYFFEEIRKETTNKETMEGLLDRFSLIMKDQLVNPYYLIEENLKVIKELYGNSAMHIVSGSDQTELRYLCKCLKIDHFFESINGSPTPKIELVKKLIQYHKYLIKDCVLIGDSVNDFEAAQANEISFVGYNYP